MGGHRCGWQRADTGRGRGRACRRRPAACQQVIGAVPPDPRSPRAVSSGRGRSRGNFRQQEPGIDLEARRRPRGRVAGASRTRPAGCRIFGEHGQEIGSRRRPCRERAGADDGAAPLARLRYRQAGRCRRAGGGDLPRAPCRHCPALGRGAMIAKLAGILDTAGPDSAVIDVGGVGYLVFCSARTIERLPPPGGAARLSIETHVREDHIHLYGFIDAAERDWFRLLTTVQGVGARLALAILSAVAPEALTLAILAQDKAALARADGVGPKLAARIVNELRDKVGGLAIAMEHASAVATLTSLSDGAPGDAVSALVNLGYRRAEAFGAVAAASRRLGEGAAIDALIRAGLQELAQAANGANGGAVR